MANVVVYTKSQLLRAVNDQQSGLPIPITDVTATMTTPLPVVGSAGNSHIVVTGTETAPSGADDVYTGTVDVIYNRLDLALLFKGVGFIWEGKTETSLYAILPDIALRYGIAFTTDDVADVSFPDLVLAKQINFTAKAASLNFVGTTKLTVQRPPISLNELNRDLDIYLVNDPPSDFKYDYTNVLPFNGYRATRGVDFSRYAAQLDGIAANATLQPLGRSDLIKIMQYEYCYTLVNPIGDIRVTVTTPTSTTKRVTLTVPECLDKLEFTYTPA